MVPPATPPMMGTPHNPSPRRYQPQNQGGGHQGKSWCPAPLFFTAGLLYTQNPTHITRINHTVTTGYCYHTYSPHPPTWG